MKKIILSVLLTLLVVFIFRACRADRKAESMLQENSRLIQEQISNVSKLIVTEGHFAEVYTYKDSQELFGPLITAEKKALVVVNAEVDIAYDLRLIDFEVDEVNKTLYIKGVPDPEITITPDFEYYDVTADYLNPFGASDYNTIKKNVNTALMEKIEASSLKRNAKNRLLSELQKFYVLTNSFGWTLVYGDRTIDRPESWEVID